MEVREKEVQSLQSQALALSQEDAGLTEVDGQQRRVTDTFSNLQDPLNLRRQRLLASKEAHQFNRDLEDEIVSRSAQRVILFFGILFFWKNDLHIIHYSVFLSALGEREDAFGNLHRPWKRPPDCTAVD